MLVVLACTTPTSAGPPSRDKTQTPSTRRAAQLQKPAEEQVDSRPAAQRPPRLLAYVVATLLLFFLFYALVIALMALVGLVLAYFTRGLRALDLLAKPPDRLVERGRVGRTVHESWLTRAYGIVLALALVLFYAAIPFVIWGLLLFTLVVMVAGHYFRRGYQSALLHDRMVYAGAGSVGAVFNALFVRFPRGGFGLLKESADCPRLFEVLREVARRVDTEAVDEVFLDPGCSVSVHQEGRGPFGIFGVKRRVLSLGISTMHFLTVDELKAILAHEYAHFSHADTFWICFIYQVTLSIATATRGMFEVGGWLTFANPFYWFFYLFQKAYALLSSGFSRSREFLADRMACSLYGSNVFATALEKVCTDGVFCQKTIYQSTADMLEDGKAYVNMYLAFRKAHGATESLAEPDQLRKKLLREEPSLLRTHPTFAERVRAIEHLPPADKLDPAPAMQLFESPAVIEKELTDFLSGALQQQRRLRRRRF
jgi:Peptidase family M48